MRLAAWFLVAAVLAGCSDDAADATGASGAGGASNNTSATNGPGSGPGGAGGSGGAAEMALVHRVGRFDDSDSAGPRSSWSETSFRTRLDGTAISVHVDAPDGVFFQVVVDGQPTTVVRTDQGDAVYELATGLAPGQHDIEIHRRNEGFFGNVQFFEFSPGTGGTLIESPSPYLHRLEFIGDSLTCGYGIEGVDPCQFTGDTESAYSTYAAVASRNVSAAAHLIAYSGKGVFQNYGGDPNEPMPELYPRTLTNDAAPAWDFSSFVADAVVINLGTNDFSAPIQESDFVGAYVDLLTTIRGHYPNAAIFCVTWQHWGATHQGYVTTAIAQFGDSAVHEVEFSIDSADGSGCDGHTNTVTNAKLGALLTSELESTLGW